MDGRSYKPKAVDVEEWILKMPAEFKDPIHPVTADTVGDLLHKILRQVPGTMSICQEEPFYVFVDRTFEDTVLRFVPEFYPDAFCPKDVEEFCEYLSGLRKELPMDTPVINFNDDEGIGAYIVHVDIESDIRLRFTSEEDI